VKGRGALSCGSKEPLNKNVICTYIYIKKALKTTFLFKTPETKNLFEIFLKHFLFVKNS
jgi:hypothetical protein